MAILSITAQQPAGLASVTPSIVYILTSDTYAQVTTTGYLTNAKQEGFVFNNQQMALVYTSDQGPVWLSIKITYNNASILSTVISLTTPDSPGETLLPTIANNIIVSTNTIGTLANLTGVAINHGGLQAGISGIAGTLTSFPSAVTSGKLTVAAVTNSSGDFNTTISNASAVGQSQVISIPDSGATTANVILSKSSANPQHITVGGLQVDAGSISSGLATGGFVGQVSVFPTTASKGSLSLLAAINATGNFTATISNAVAQAQSTVYTLPDVTATTAGILAAGAALISGNLPKASGVAGAVVD
jgi:hypothetical protein